MLDSIVLIFHAITMAHVFFKKKKISLLALSLIVGVSGLKHKTEKYVMMQNPPKQLV
jgi:hypothetical protein